VGRLDRRTHAVEDTSVHDLCCIGVGNRDWRERDSVHVRECDLLPVPGGTRSSVVCPIAHRGGRVKQGVKWAAVGIGLGVFGGFVSTFWLSRYIERVQWLDPIAFLVTSLLIATIAGAACYVPATRASHVDPMVVLREE